MSDTIAISEDDRGYIKLDFAYDVVIVEQKVINCGDKDVHSVVMFPHEAQKLAKSIMEHYSEEATP